MKKFILSISPILILTGSQAFAQTMGFVTPNKISLTINGIYLIDTSNSNVNVMNQKVPVSFTDTDTDFSQASFSEIQIPEGRFLGAIVGYESGRTVVLGSHPYQGKDGSSVHDGEYVCSTSTGWTVQSSVCSSSSPLTFDVSGGATASYFAKPICVTTASKKASVCQSSDSFIDASVPSNLVFNVMVDLYNNLNLDADTLTYSKSSNYQSLASGNAFPYVVFGGAGAAVHLSSHTSGPVNVGEITLLFDSNKTLINTYTFQTKNGGTGPTGICDGPSFQNATAAPTGSVLNPWGLTYIGQYDSNSGKVAFVTNDRAGKGGINVLSDIRQSASTALSMNCFADSDNTNISNWNPGVFQSYLGYTYTALPGNAAGSAVTNMKVVKITDPKGILGVSGCGNGVTTNCGNYP
jgi:hypothetical protein